MNTIIIFDIDEKFNESNFLDHEIIDILYRLKTIDNLDIGIVSSNNIIDEHLFERNKEANINMNRNGNYWIFTPVENYPKNYISFNKNEYENKDILRELLH